MGLTRSEAVKILKELNSTLAGEKCRTCDCVQGLLIQLQLDGAEDISDILNPLLVSKDRLHGCLGCSPCPGGEAFARYIRKSQNR